MPCRQWDATLLHSFVQVANSRNVTSTVINSRRLRVYLGLHHRSWKVLEQLSSTWLAASRRHWPLQRHHVRIDSCVNMRLTIEPPNSCPVHVLRFCVFFPTHQVERFDPVLDIPSEKATMAVTLCELSIKRKARRVFLGQGWTRLFWNRAWSTRVSPVLRIDTLPDHVCSLLLLLSVVLIGVNFS